MTKRSDYTDEEWATLRRAPMVAGLAISLADPGGPIKGERTMLEQVGKVLGVEPA